MHSFPWYDVVFILAVILVAGFVSYMIDRSPATAEPYKSWGKWVVLGVAGILVILSIFHIVKSIT